MVCSCLISSKRVLLQIIFRSCEIESPLLCETWQVAVLSCEKKNLVIECKTTIERSYRIRSRFVSVSKIKYFPLTIQPVQVYGAKRIPTEVIVPLDLLTIKTHENVKLIIKYGGSDYFINIYNIDRTLRAL